MTTANVGLVTARSVTPVPLFTTTTDQFGKTVFTGKASPVTVILPTQAVASAANISYSATTGVYTLDAGVGYQLIAEGTINNYKSATPALFQWVNAANGSAIGPAVPVGSTCVAYQKSGSTNTVALTVIAGSTPFDYPAQLSNNVRTNVLVVTGWTQ